MNENITNTNTLSNDLSSMGGINLKETLNVPDYDPIKYPMPKEDDVIIAYNMIYKLQLVSSSIDKNLQALVMKMYITINDYLVNRDDSLTNGYMKQLSESLNNLKEYCKKSKNPLIK